MKLRIAAGPHGHMAAMRDGAAAPRSVQLDHIEVASIAPAFVRMVRALEYDVCEMTFGTYLCAKALGHPLAALPVFVLRGMHHGALLRPGDSEITGPQDLVGRRVGAGRGWTRTAGIWARAILADEYGIGLDDVKWVVAGDEDVPGYQPPDAVLRWSGDRSILDLVLKGDLAAATGVRSDELTSVIGDPDGAGFRALRERGFYPINHLIVLREDLLTSHPELAIDLFEAFAASKRRYIDSIATGGLGRSTAADRLYQRVMTTTGADPLPYGVAPNRPMISALLRHALEQRVITTPLDVEHVFAAGTLDLVG